MGENCSHLDPFRFGTKPSTIRSMPPRERAEGTTHAAFKSCGELAFSFIIPATLIHTCLIVSLYPNKYIYIIIIGHIILICCYIKGNTHTRSLPGEQILKENCPGRSLGILKKRYKHPIHLDSGRYSSCFFFAGR